MIKANEINQWIENANSLCHRHDSCEGCQLAGEAESGEYCRWDAGDMTQEQVDMVTACEPSVDWSKIPVDTKVIVWNNAELKYRMYFARYENGKIYTYLSGATSWSHEPGKIVRWQYGRLAEEDEE